MLKHAAPDSEARHQRDSRAVMHATPPPATDPTVRATPDEIARALAAIEARRSGTDADRAVPIAEVVAELGPDISVNEVRAEVEAGRRRAEETARHEGQRRRRRRRLATLVAAAALVGVGGPWLFGAWTPATTPQEIARMRREFFLRPETLVRDRDDAGKPILRTLAEVPDGRAVRAAVRVGKCGADACVGIADVTEAAPTGNFGEPWRIIKYAGRPYLRAFTAPASDAALTGRTVHLYREAHGGTPVPTAGAEPLRVTVPLDGLRSASRMDPFGEVGDWLAVEDLRPDGHLREAWDDAATAADH